MLLRWLVSGRGNAHDNLQNQKILPVTTAAACFPHHFLLHKIAQMRTHKTKAYPLPCVFLHATFLSSSFLHNSRCSWSGVKDKGSGWGRDLSILDSPGVEFRADCTFKRLNREYWVSHLFSSCSRTLLEENANCGHAELPRLREESMREAGLKHVGPLKAWLEKSWAQQFQPIRREVDVNRITEVEHISTLKLLRAGCGLKMSNSNSPYSPFQRL